MFIKYNSYPNPCKSLHFHPSLFISPTFSLSLSFSLLSPFFKFSFTLSVPFQLFSLSFYSLSISLFLVLSHSLSVSFSYSLSLPLYLCYFFYLLFTFYLHLSIFLKNIVLTSNPKRTFYLSFISLFDPERVSPSSTRHLRTKRKISLIIVFKYISLCIKLTI